MKPLAGIQTQTNHDSLMNEPSPQLKGVEMRVLLRGCHGDIPDPPPGIVEWLVDWVDARVVRGDRVGQVSDGNTMLLE